MLARRRRGLVAAPPPQPAFAQDWKAKYPELDFAIVPAENASGVTDRYAPVRGLPFARSSA